jgi:hypothetical protein
MASLARAALMERTGRTVLLARMASTELLWVNPYLIHRVALAPFAASATTTPSPSSKLGIGAVT